MSIEKEVKLSVGPMFQLPDLSEVVPGAMSLGEGPLRFVASYYDTPDLRLARWGCSLRYRTGEGWCVKLPLEAVNGKFVRDERIFEAGPGRPPEAAVDLVRAYVRTAPLRLAVRLQTLRKRVAIVDGEHVPMAEVVDDEVSVLDGRRVAGRFREIEVELAAGADDDAVLDAVTDRLAAAGAQTSGEVPKFVRALLPRSADPPEIVVGKVGPKSAVVDVVRASIAASAERMLRYDAGVRLGEDPEAVHQARVATRRLRSDLRTFRSLLDPEWNEDLRAELGWLGRELGTVRDLDVLDERLRTRVKMLPDEDTDVAPKLLDRVRTERDAARAELTSAMREPRYLALLDRVVAAASEPAVLPEVADAAALQTMGALLDGPWRHLQRTADQLRASSMDTELHQVRIRAKRARYAAEALIPVFGKPSRRFAARAAELQTLLGEHQDAVMAVAWLRAQTGGTAARTAFAAGELAGIERQAQATAREALPAVWRALRPKRLRAWTAGS
jgi:CHAD domain-containing protein